MDITKSDNDIKIKRVISAKFADYNNSIIDLNLELTNGDIIPYGYCITSPSNSPLSNEITALYRNCKLKIEKYSGPTKLEIESCRCRRLRNEILDDTDIILATPDYPISVSQKKELKAYRQALRDITKQPGFPENVVWPTVPDCIKDKIYAN